MAMVALPPRSTLLGMRSLVAVNSHNRVCACDADCWCNTTRVGRAIKWRVPARLLSRIGIHHKNRQLEEWKRASHERQVKFFLYAMN